MPTAQYLTMSNTRLEPYYYPDKSRTRAVNLAPGTYVAGQVLGQFTQAAGNEVQTLTATGTVSGGTYTLGFEGEVTGNLAYNASVATVQAALDAFFALDPGDVVVGGGAFPGTPLTFTFGGKYANRNVPLIVVTSAVTGGGSIAMTETTAGKSGPGTYGKYVDANTDGTGVAVCFLKWPCTVNNDGSIDIGVTPDGTGDHQFTAPVYDGGYFHTADVTGLDQAALDDMKGRMVEGTLSGGGVFYIP